MDHITDKYIRLVEPSKDSSANKVHAEHLQGVAIPKELLDSSKEEGRAEGRAEGLEEQKLATARLMLEDGEPIEKIIRYTGLTRDQIEKAKK